MITGTYLLFRFFHINHKQKVIARILLSAGDIISSTKKILWYIFLFSRYLSLRSFWFFGSMFLHVMFQTLNYKYYPHFPQPNVAFFMSFSVYFLVCYLWNIHWQFAHSITLIHCTLLICCLSYVSVKRLFYKNHKKCFPPLIWHIGSL